ncbi:MAG: sulfatase family protein [Aestuariibaculum sp.]
MKLKKVGIVVVVSLLIFACKNDTKNTEPKNEGILAKPNIVFVYLDDLGYGDMGAYGATAIKTPNMDMLANEGVRFTNGYATSATCTPSRYGLLTGVYPWRNKRARILPGTAPLIIDTTQYTLPKMLKTQGYKTAIIGKWHLGLGTGHVNWNEKVAPGPNEVGFDYSYILAATQDRVPTVYIEDGYVVNSDPNDPIEVDYKKNFEGEPTGKENPELLKMEWDHGHNNSIVNGIPRIGFMKGGEKAKWIDEDMADVFINQVKSYIENQKEGEPFFLYYAMQQPHVPRTPHPRFVGTTDLGPRGDVIAEADWCIGEFIKALDKKGILENTLIVFSSDNGPVLNDGYKDDAVEKNGTHKPKGALRGGKYSMFEAGAKVPFITYWKGKIQPGVSDAVVCQIDLMASLASLVGADPFKNDSENLINVFMGKSLQGRKELILEASGKTILRQGDWVMIPPYKGAVKNPYVDIELGNSNQYQLYNLKEDVGQQTNLAETKPEQLKAMKTDYIKIRKGSQNGVGELELK